MGAALHSVDSEPPQADTGKRESAVITSFERPSELNHTRALGYISHLEATVNHLHAEISALRLALARSEHEIIRREQLLRNAMQRERELRKQLGEALK
jgi:hypothetical protein